LGVFSLAVMEAAMEELKTLSSVSIKQVLFATDFSEHSAAALRYAVSLARTPGGKLVVAHVVAMGPLRAGFPAHGPRWSSWRAG
jgi:hypothetical protein